MVNPKSIQTLHYSSDSDNYIKHNFQEILSKSVTGLQITEIKCVNIKVYN